MKKNQSAQVSEKKEDVMQSTEANEEAIITEQNHIVSSDSYDDSIATQFLDGESILKNCLCPRRRNNYFKRFVQSIMFLKKLSIT